MDAQTTAPDKQGRTLCVKLSIIRTLNFLFCGSVRAISCRISTYGWEEGHKDTNTRTDGRTKARKKEVKNAAVVTIGRTWCWKEGREGVGTPHLLQGRAPHGIVVPNEFDGHLEGNHRI